jgi:hypothetical protein
MELRNLTPLLRSANIGGLHKGHHFIPMAIEVHGEPEHDMDHFIWEYAHLFHNR